MNFVFNKLFMTNKTLLQVVLKTFSKRNINISLPAPQKMTSNQDTCTDIVWMDLELTGLDEVKDKILEVSCFITNKDLNIKAEGPCFAINHPEEVFQNMDDWCKQHHRDSGLIEKCLQSQISNEKGEQLILDFLKQNVPKKASPLAGNSIYMDRLFLRRLMPSVNDYLHYRIIDVSTIKELAQRWHPKILDKAPQKKLNHRSLDDIYESIEELNYFKKTFFRTFESEP